MPNAIETRALTKSFGRTVALDGLDLTVRTGEVHAFLGPNGAGKTTTIRILLGLLRKDGGEAVLLGGDPWRDAVSLHRRLAYVPGDVTLWPGLTGGQIIDLLGRLRGGLDAKRRQELTERFDLDPAKKTRAYSKGNRQKIALIAALASDAELLLLDEPTAGLDPLMEAAFRDCVNEERSDGRTILLSSHILAEAEALSDRVTIIRAGRAVETGTLAQMRHLTRDLIEAELAGPVSLDGVPGVHDLVTDGARLRCEVDHAALNEVLARLTAAGVRSLTCRPPTLEELFLRHYSSERTVRRGPAMTVLAHPGRTAGGLTGTGQLVRLAVRRDRIALPAVVYVIAVAGGGHGRDVQAALPDGGRAGRPGRHRRQQPGLALPVQPDLRGLSRIAHHLAVRDVGRHLRRAGGDLRGDQAHPVRRGGGPAGAGRLGRRGPPGGAGRRAGHVGRGQCRGDGPAGRAAAADRPARGRLGPARAGHRLLRAGLHRDRRRGRPADLQRPHRPRHRPRRPRVSPSCCAASATRPARAGRPGCRGCRRSAGSSSPSRSPPGTGGC